MALQINFTLFRNADQSDTTTTLFTTVYDGSKMIPALPSVSAYSWSNGTKEFKEWNTQRDGTGTGFQAGDYLIYPSDIYDANYDIYAIWENPPSGYVKNNWQTGDTVTAEKLNHMEDGIADGQTLVVTVTAEGNRKVADKTYNEIAQAISNGSNVSAKYSNKMYVLGDLSAAAVSFFSLSTGRYFSTITISNENNVTATASSFPLYLTPPNGIRETDLAQGVKDKLLRVDYNRAQYLPVLFDGLSFSPSLTPQQIAEGYTLSKEEGEETITVNCPAFQQSSYTLAYIYSTGYQWYEGAKFMLYPDYSNVDGVTFHSPIVGLGDIGLTGYVGVLEISPDNGHVNNYVATLHYWQDAGAAT